MFTKNFNLSDSLIETAAKLLEESSKKASKNPSSTNHEENMTEASNEEPNINHLELSEEELNELSPATLQAYREKSRERIRNPNVVGHKLQNRQTGYSTATKKLSGDARVRAKEPANKPTTTTAPKQSFGVQAGKITPKPTPYNPSYSMIKEPRPSGGSSMPPRAAASPMKEEVDEEVMPSGMSMKERTAFNRAAAEAAKQGEPHFKFGGKKFKTTMQKDVAHKMTEARKPKTSDYDDSDEDPEGGSRPSEHIMNQLRKASMTMKKEHPVKYSDGKTGMVDRHVAKALVNHYNSLSKAHQKETMQSKIGKSHKHLTDYHDRLHESMYDPTINNKTKTMKTLVEKKPKKLDEVPAETMKQVKMVNQEKEQVKHKEVIDPNTDKTVEVRHRKPMDPNTDKSIQEREMTPAEKAKREKIVMALKKKMSGFKDRYGERAKDVMYATATKQAMKEEDEAAPKSKTMTGEKKDGVNVKPEMITRGSGGIKSTTT